MKSYLIPLLMLLFLWMSAGCSMHTTRNTPSKKNMDPLEGKIIQTHDGRSITLDTLIDRMLETDIVYLSEKHDNPAHHRLQMEIIKGLVRRGRPPRLGFEFFSMAQTPLLLNYVDVGKAPHSDKMDRKTARIMRKKLGWEQQTDEMWSYYLALLDLAKKEKLVTVGLDLTDSQIKRLSRKGYDQLESIEKKHIFTTPPMPASYRRYMFDIFTAAHCGMKNPAMQSRRYDAWTARNDKMALSLTRLVEQDMKGPVVVIIGAGHTTYGLGVINRVRVINPALRQLNVGLKEINKAVSPLESYLPPLDLEGFKPTPPFDYICFTQRVKNYKDPCEKYRRMFKKNPRIQRRPHNLEPIAE